MILRLTPNVARSCIQLSHKSNGMPYLCSDVKLEIHKLAPPDLAAKEDRCGKSNINCRIPRIVIIDHDCGCGCGDCGCNHSMDTEDYGCGCEGNDTQSTKSCNCDDTRPTIPLLEVTPTSQDDEGRICFDWDAAVYGLENGRYIAKILTIGGECLSEFQIEIACDKLEITGIQNTIVNTDCGGCDGDTCSS